MNPAPPVIKICMVTDDLWRNQGAGGVPRSSSSQTIFCRSPDPGPNRLPTPLILESLVASIGHSLCESIVVQSFQAGSSKLLCRISDQNLHFALQIVAVSA